MILGLGTDIVEVGRFEKIIQKFGLARLKKLFTAMEWQRAVQSPHPARVCAKRFAAKEACLKALGTGMSQGISWHDIEVGNLSSGKPVLMVTHKAQQHLESLIPTGFKGVVHLSLSDTAALAQATVIIEGIPL